MNNTNESNRFHTLDPSHDEEWHPSKAGPKSKFEVTPKANMLPPSTIMTEALVKQATPPGHLHIKTQIAREQLIKKFNWDIVDAYGKLGQLMKAKVASGLTPTINQHHHPEKDIGGLEGQKIQLKDKMPSNKRESPQMRDPGAI